jgi:hypothetical protein
MPVKHKTLPTAEYLHAAFDYDPLTGVIRWRGRRGNKKAGHLEKGYLNLTIDGVHYRAARVIWKLITGDEPPEIVDHIDRVKLNNRWSNLRAATPSQSLRNRNPWKQKKFRKIFKNHNSDLHNLR